MTFQVFQKTQDIIDLFNFIAAFISILTGIVSLILAAVAVWLTLHFKTESDAVNKETRSLLMDVRLDAKTIATVAMPELQASHEWQREIAAKLLVAQGVNMEIGAVSTTQHTSVIAMPPTEANAPQAD